MNKTTFKNLLSQKIKSFSLNKKTIQHFREFKLLNEAFESILTSRQIRAKYKYRGKLEKEPELKEQYYCWHLLNAIDVKWTMIKLDVIVKRYYRNSKIIKEIYEGGENGA